MSLFVIRGKIKRRILVNYRVDPIVFERHIPKQFRPKLHKGWGIAGICLIRLEEIRPGAIPSLFGLNSENAAHRYAVTWQRSSEPSEGVYIARRDTSSYLNHLLGGRVFPGEHELAKFDVVQCDQKIRFNMQSQDRTIEVDFKAEIVEALPKSSIFQSMEEISSFFQAGSLGYSKTSDKKKLDGLVLKTLSWKMESLEVADLHSSYFENLALFPKGSIEFDSALLMQNINHEWHQAPEFYI